MSKRANIFRGISDYLHVNANNYAQDPCGLMWEGIIVPDFLGSPSRHNRVALAAQSHGLCGAIAMPSRRERIALKSASTSLDSHEAT